MAAWLQRYVSSKQAHLAVTVVASGAFVACTILGIQAIRLKVARDDLKASIPNIDEHHQAETVPDFGTKTSQSITSKEEERAAALAVRALNGDYDEELVQEQLTRTSAFLTAPGLEKIRSAFVIVVGLGGVGSHCTAALARSGVSHIRIIDFDQVTLSSLNRHAMATLADVGTPKVTCVRKRLEAVVPWVKWETFGEVWREDQADRLLGGLDNGAGAKPDYVVDAIDDIDSKVTLLKCCHSRGIKVISSMGAGCKSDPTRILVGDISSSIEDPLSRSTRRRLRAAGISNGIPVAYSIEKQGPGKAALLPLPDEEFQRGSVGELSVLPDFRARILPVLGTVPAVFGYVIANYVIMELSGYPHETGGGKGRDKLYESALQNLQKSEERLARSEGEEAFGLKVPVTKEDVGYLIDEVFRGKSVVSGLSTRITLVRWRASEDGYKASMTVAGQKSSRLQLGDLVCMTKEEAAAHEQRTLIGRARPEDVYEARVVGLVKQRLHEERAYNRYR